MKTAGTALLIAGMTAGLLGCSKSPVTVDPQSLGLAGRSDRGPAGPIAGDCGSLPTAPPSQRVDLYEPAFTNPTSVTNPLFPISNLSRALLLGKVDGVPLRVETTLLARTQSIRVDGRAVEALVSQYVAWLDGRIEEVAIDYYTQDDQGAAWYLGEDVSNYEDGRIADTEGTWRAGRDGPPAMIMPAHPLVGNVWRPENICGFVFEEVEATETGFTVAGPRGPVADALRVRELHMDGSYEDKIFAPGYGEFSTGSGDNLEAIALAIPADALSGEVPAELLALSSGAARLFHEAPSGQWQSMATIVAAMNAAWGAYRAQGVPPMIEAQMNDALASLAQAVASQDVAATRGASITVARSGLDFQLRYLPKGEIDLAHIDLWSRQLLFDAAAHDRAGVRSDMVSIKLVKDRLRHALDRDLEALLETLQSAALAENLEGATQAADRLQDALARATRSVPAL